MRDMRPTNNDHQIVNFTGQYEFLSNFFVRHFAYRDVVYSSAEHAYQAAKAITTEDHNLVMNAKTPREARRLGQKIAMREDWEEVRVPTLHAILVAKFHQHPDLLATLLETSPKLLIEGNTWGDRFWGAVYERNAWTGENNLGKLLMKLRDEK